MKTRIIRIGNSQGVRIPKPILEESGLAGDVHLNAERGRIVIRAAEPPRSDWEEAFRDMAEQGDDALLDGDSSIGSSWDEEEWRW